MQHMFTIFIYLCLWDFFIKTAPPKWSFFVKFIDFIVLIPLYSAQFHDLLTKKEWKRNFIAIMFDRSIASCPIKLYQSHSVSKSVIVKELKKKLCPKISSQFLLVFNDLWAIQTWVQWCVWIAYYYGTTSYAFIVNKMYLKFYFVSHFVLNHSILIMCLHQCEH